jgi:hypothetical protein
MCRSRAGLLAVVATGVLISAIVAQAPSRPPIGKSGGLLVGLFPATKDEKAKKDKPTTPAPVAREREQDRLRNAYLRRLEVCDRLAQIAEETNNSKLAEEAAELANLAWENFEKQCSRIPGAKMSLEGEANTNSDVVKMLTESTPKGNLPPRLRSTRPMENARTDRPSAPQGDNR